MDASSNSKNSDFINVISGNNWEIQFETIFLWDESLNIFRPMTLQLSFDSAKPYQYDGKNYSCEIVLKDSKGEGTLSYSDADNVTCEYIGRKNVGIVLLDSDTVLVLTDDQLLLLDQLNAAKGSFHFFKYDRLEELQINNNNGTIKSCINENGDLEISLDQLYIWDFEEHDFEKSSMVIKYSLDSDNSFPVSYEARYQNCDAGRSGFSKSINFNFIEDIGISIFNRIIMILSKNQKEFFQK